jgi:hypothetical protein
MASQFKIGDKKQYWDPKVRNWFDVTIADVLSSSYVVSFDDAKRPTSQVPFDAEFRGERIK